MNGKSWVLASVLSAIALTAAAAAPAQADERWNLGRAQWQPPTRAGWVNAERERAWNGRADWAHQRNDWWRREQERRRWEQEEERRRAWWHRHHHHHHRWD